MGVVRGWEGATIVRPEAVPRPPLLEPTVIPEVIESFGLNLGLGRPALRLRFLARLQVWGVPTQPVVRECVKPEGVICTRVLRRRICRWQAILAGDLLPTTHVQKDHTSSQQRRSWELTTEMSAKS